MHESLSNEPKKTVPLFVGLMFVCMVVVRLFLPVQMNDSMGFYSATSWAVIEHQNWGKQVLAGVMEYSPLPACLMIILAPLGKLSFLHISSAQVMVAVSQSAVVCILYMLLGEFCRNRWARLGLAVLSLIAIGLGTGFWVPAEYLASADPFWILLVPLGMLLLFAARLETAHSLRPVLGYSLSCSLLMFAGPAGTILALAALAVLFSFGRSELKAQGGTPLLVMMPFIYAILLQLLFNLVIMGDLFFSVKRLLPYFQQETPTLFTSWRTVAAVLWAIVVIGALVIIKRIPFFIRLAWVLAIAAVPVFLFRKGGMIFVGGEYLMLGMISLCLVISGFNLLLRSGVKLKTGIPALAVTTILLVSVTGLRRYSTLYESYLNDPRPSREQITTFIDKDWVGSRVLVFGARAATLFCVSDSDDPALRDRFIGNIDFNRYVVAEHMEAEQLHLLLPPDNGKYYPRGDNFFSQLYRDEQPDWLHLEAVMDGWQLWRCVRKLPQKGSM